MVRAWAGRSVPSWVYGLRARPVPDLVSLLHDAAVGQARKASACRQLADHAAFNADYFVAEPAAFGALLHR